MNADVKVTEVVDVDDDITFGKKHIYPLKGKKFPDGTEIAFCGHRGKCMGIIIDVWNPPTNQCPICLALARYGK